MENSTRFESNDPNSSTPSTQINWKNISKEELDFILLNKEGFDRVTHLEGDDAATVADFLDTCSSDISDARTRYITALYTLCSNSGLLPSSHIITEALETIGTEPVTGGAYADVWKGRYKDRIVAITALRLYSLDELPEMKKRFFKEAIIWKCLCHPNILPFLGASIRALPNSLSLVSLWMENGNLHAFLKNPGVDRFSLFRDIAKGLSYLHSQDLIHGNLNGSNILIALDGQACLADFGLSRIDSRIPEYFMDVVNYSGTIRWMAPELLNAGGCGFKVSKESDIYALGMVIYEIITGDVPFPRLGNLAVMGKILNGLRPERPTYSRANEFVDVVWTIAEKCWHKHPHERFSISEVLEHQMFASVDACSSSVESPRLVPHEVTSDIVISSQSIRRHTVTQPKEDRRSEVESSIAIQNDDSNHTLPSAPTDWKTVDKAYLDSVLETKEGFQRLTELDGDDAVIVADMIDNIIESRDITVNQGKKKIYLAILRKLCGNRGIFPTSYTLAAGLEKVGESPKAGGAFADVWEGMCKNRPVAIKAFRVYKDNRLKKLYCKEVVVWKWLIHPNVLPFLGVATSPFPFCVASPWMVHGNLNEYLRSHPQADRYPLFNDIVDGLDYLHSSGIIHGDMKGANILINDTYRACLADFGLTTIAPDAILAYSINTVTTGGTPRWMAPELLYPEKYGLEKGVPSKESDIYALGIVIYEVITGDVPYKRTTNPFLCHKVPEGYRPERPIPRELATSNFTNDVWPIAEECWREHRNERPTLSHILGLLRLPD